MPIRYSCVGCREELLLPDAKAGELCACPFCRLKFLAPLPVARAANPGTVAPRSSQLPSRPAPPLYPVDVPAETNRETGGLFGLEAADPASPPSLFGMDQVEVGELFGGLGEEDDSEDEETPALRPIPVTPPRKSFAPDSVFDQPTPALGYARQSRPREGFRLVAVEGLPKGTTFDLEMGSVYLIGRDREAEIKILSTSVSRRQARIDASGPQPMLIDLGSANGTQVNGESVDRKVLVDGDLLKMGVVLFRYEGG